MKQIVAHKKIGALQGVLLVLGLVAVLLALNFACSALLSRLIGYNAASLLFWILGALVAWQVLRVFIAKFVYEMDEDVLRISRKYGRKERFIEDIYLSRLLFDGSPEEAKKRYSEARRVNAVHPGVKDNVTAVAYQTSSGIRIALTQVNGEFKEKLVSRMKGR